MPNPQNIIPPKKGEPSRNPKGRGKGVKNRATIARYWLEAAEKANNPITGKSEHLTQEDIMTLALIKRAQKGDTNAYKALMDSGYGMPSQQVESKSEVKIKVVFDE